MKTFFNLLVILLVSFFIYGQEETRISQNLSSKYVEPYIATNPANGDILAVYFTSPQPGNLEYVVIRNGSIFTSGSFANGIDPSCAFDGN